MSDLNEMIAKVHDDMEGRYDLTVEDLHIIQYMLCLLQPKSNMSAEEAAMHYHAKNMHKSSLDGHPVGYYIAGYKEGESASYSKIATLEERVKELEGALTAAKIMMERDKVGGYTRTHDGKDFAEKGSTYEKVSAALSNQQNKI